MSEPTALDRIAYLSISLYGDGAMSISGNLGDKRLALQMIDHARDTIRAQLRERPDSGLFLPPRDVDVVPDPRYPALQQASDVAPELRAHLPTDP